MLLLRLQLLLLLFGMIFVGRSFNPKIIQRERLASCLLDEIREKYGSAVTVKYQSDCTHVEWTHTGKEEELCHLKVKQRTLTDGEEHVSEFTEQSSFVIGADGAQSSVRTAMEEDKFGGFFVKKYEDKNVRQSEFTVLVRNISCDVKSLFIVFSFPTRSFYFLSYSDRN